MKPRKKQIIGSETVQFLNLTIYCQVLVAERAEYRVLCMVGGDGIIHRSQGGRAEGIQISPFLISGTGHTDLPLSDKNEITVIK